MFSACENKKTTDLTVHWDRDMCSRCVMVISDRHNTVQVINPETNKKYVFDDIGCMAVWFKKENISWSGKANIWINDVKTGEWIDAKVAFYDTENVTPMGYGFSAHKLKADVKKGQEALDFNEVEKRILKSEE
jgi:nitrous oxide reductase accessory protein NosL